MVLLFSTSQGYFAKCLVFWILSRVFCECLHKARYLASVFFCLLKQAQDKMKESFDLKAVQCEFGPAANCSVQPLMPNAVGHAWSLKEN